MSERRMIRWGYMPEATGADLEYVYIKTAEFLVLKDEGSSKIILKTESQEFYLHSFHDYDLCSGKCGDSFEYDMEVYIYGKYEIKDGRITLYPKLKGQCHNSPYCQESPPEYLEENENLEPHICDFSEERIEIWFFHSKGMEIIKAYSESEKAKKIKADDEVVEEEEEELRKEKELIYRFTLDYEEVRRLDILERKEKEKKRLAAGGEDEGWCSIL